MESVKKTRKPTRYESLVDELLEYLDSVFRKYLVCPQTLTLHEVFYYNSVSDVRRHINASPRAAIQTALNNPYHYLQGEHTPADTEGILATMPDVCIAYKLHMECGRLINLYDWLQVIIWTFIFSHWLHTIVAFVSVPRACTCLCRAATTLWFCRKLKQKVFPCSDKQIWKKIPGYGNVCPCMLIVLLLITSQTVVHNLPDCKMQILAALQT